MYKDREIEICFRARMLTRIAELREDQGCTGFLVRNLPSLTLGCTMAKHLNDQYVEMIDLLWEEHKDKIDPEQAKMVRHIVSGVVGNRVEKGCKGCSGSGTQLAKDVSEGGKSMIGPGRVSPMKLQLEAYEKALGLKDKRTPV